MFKTIVNAFKVKEIRNKILITLALLLVYRVGCWLPVPGLVLSKFSEAIGTQDFLSLISSISGGALSQGAILALGISPYISASIIIQLLTIAIPSLERLSKQGEEGRKRIGFYTKICALVLAIAQAVAIVISYGFISTTSPILSKTISKSSILIAFFITSESFTSTLKVFIFLGIIVKSNLLFAANPIQNKSIHMKHTTIYLTILLLFAGSSVSAQTATTQDSLMGTWELRQRYPNEKGMEITYTYNETEETCTLRTKEGKAKTKSYYYLSETVPDAFDYTQVGKNKTGKYLITLSGKGRKAQFTPFDIFEIVTLSATHMQLKQHRSSTLFEYDKVAASQSPRHPKRTRTPNPRKGKVPINNDAIAIQ